MAPNNNEMLSVRDKLEFLLESDGKRENDWPNQKSSNSDQSPKAFLAGASFSGLIAASIFLTHYVDTQLTGQTGIQKTDGRAAVSRSAVLPTAAKRSLITNQEPQEIPFAKERGLGASKSVLTGVVDPQTLTASYYWTIVLNNTNSSSREAKFNITLPEGSVVSRATLWINGRAEEAAFNTTSSVQNAYDWIVSRNRDPLLITQIASNKISVKASPVMPNEEMKLRIGMTVPVMTTAEGGCVMNLPFVHNSNLSTSCTQNIHLTSVSPLSASDSRLSSPHQKSGFLLRGNLEDKDLEKVQIRMHRDPEIKRFATRATHANPPAFILAELTPINGDRDKLILTRVNEKPDCPIIADDHAAFRLSYLWAKQEIERLVAINDQFQAEELATVYRVVSPVSGAVVLERQSDYDYNGLDRNMYRSLDYAPNDKRQAHDALANYALPRPDRAGAPRPPAMPRPSARPASERTGAARSSEHSRANESRLVGSNRRVAPEPKRVAQKMPTTKSNSVLHSSENSNLASLPSLSDSSSNQGAFNSVATATDNQFVKAQLAAIDLAGPLCRNPLYVPILTPLALMSMRFIGPLSLILGGFLLFLRRNRFAVSCGLTGFTWLTAALINPIFSQILFALVITLLATKAAIKWARRVK